MITLNQLEAIEIEDISVNSFATLLKTSLKKMSEVTERMSKYMKSRPLVLTHLKTVPESIMIDFTFENNITILTGPAGTGKTMAFSFIKECEASDSDILCLNYLNTQEEIESKISESKGKLIVIDNADVLLTDNIRKHISMDDKNQYLIIGRNPKNLFATKENIFELEKNTVNNCVVFKLISCF